MLVSWMRALWACLLLASVANAQFQFFEHMFGGGHQEHAQAESQNVPSDSSRYQRHWEAGEFRPASWSYTGSESIKLMRSSQPIATNTYAPARWRAYTSHIIVRVHIRMSRRRWNWARGVRSVSLRAGSRRARQRGRLSWLGRGFYDAECWVIE